MYRKWPVDVLETSFYLNILSFAIFNSYSLNNSDVNQKAAAYMSVIITFIVLLLIILYHVYTYTTVFSKIKKTKPARKIDRYRWSPPPDDDIHQFNELLDIIDHPVNTNDYKIKQKPVKPTQSVVEVHQPYHAPLEETKTQRVAEAIQVGVNDEVSLL